MTDPELADRTYIEPVTPEWVRKGDRAGAPRRLAADDGRADRAQRGDGAGQGRHAERFGVELIGANARAISDGGRPGGVRRRDAAHRLATPVGRTVASVAEAIAAVGETGFPRSFDHRTTWAARARHRLQSRRVRGDGGAGAAAVATAYDLIERSVLGWKEFELEVMRDRRDKRGHRMLDREPRSHGRAYRRLHHGGAGHDPDDREYQRMRDAAIAVIREIGVEAGGCNIQFAVNPADGEMLVIEMNPRVSRSSALASKATGFPIARIGTSWPSATRWTSCRTTSQNHSGVVRARARLRRVKVPRFAFESFHGRLRLTTQMKSVERRWPSDARSRKRFKGDRALEIGRPGWVVGGSLADDRLTSDTPEDLRVALRTPTPERVFQIKRALLAASP